MIARTEPGVERALVVVELDPVLLSRVRESPGFPLRKRRPETYEELTIRS